MNETKSFGRSEFRQMWLTSINELTDYQLQTESWMDCTNQNPHWSFIEFVCCYFDDVLADSTYEEFESKGWVSNAEMSVLADWHMQLDQYKSPSCNDYDHQAILSDTKWTKLVTDGASAKELLAKLLDDQERELLGRIDYSKMRLG